MKIPADVLAVLRDRAEFDGMLLRLGGDRLNPRLYKRANEVLEGAGGKWDKRQQAHVFTSDAASVVEGLVSAGEVTTLRESRAAQQYFPTPPAVVASLLALADLRAGMEVLEPSAGRGAIVSAVAELGCLVDAIEREAEHAQVLKETGCARSVQVADFLTVPTEPRYDRAVMNPPFTRQADIAHVRHALGFLRPGGLLVAVMSQSTEHHRAAESFRTLVAERGGTLERLPEGSFKESGTGVSALVAVIPASRPDGDRPAPIEGQTSSTSVPVDDGEALPSPAVLIQELKRTQRTIFRELTALERMLEPSAPTADEAPSQLMFDLGDEGAA